MKQKRWNPEFVPCGFALQNIQFACGKVIGAGAITKHKAVLNWIKQVFIERTI